LSRAAPSAWAIDSVQHHDRVRAASAGGDQIALDRTRFHAVRDGEDDEHRVDVRREDLLGREPAGHLTREPGPPPQHGADLGTAARGVVPQRHPVADDRQRHAFAGLMPQSSGGFGQPLAAGGEHAEHVVVLE
jgi:hypothetical protein